MRLEDVESKAELLRGIKAEDPELLKDIRRSVHRQLDSSWEDGVTTEWDLGDDGDFLVAELEHGKDEGVMWLLDFMPDDVQRNLRGMDAEYVKERLLNLIKEGAEYSTGNYQYRRAWAQPPAITFNNQHRGPGHILREEHVTLIVNLEDEPLAWIPEDMALEILSDLTSSESGEWFTNNGWYRSPWISGPDYILVEIDGELMREWAVDVRQEYFFKLAESDPAKAIKAFMEVMKRDHPDVHKKLKKAKPPKDVMLSYATTYMADPEDEGLAVLREAVGMFGYEGTRGETILEIDKDALRELGITRGRWWDGAPWKLVNLPPEELAYEGTLQRHCVGRYDMGYREAVERGDIQIWSLRSAFNIPVITFEVDMRSWGDAESDFHEGEISEFDLRGLRGGAIAQAKGKLNRKAGKDREEAAVLLWVFRQLDIEPDEVRDYQPVDGSEQLYRMARNPERSFDQPYTPASAAPRRLRGRQAPPSELTRYNDLKRRLMR